MVRELRCGLGDFVVGVGFGDDPAAGLCQRAAAVGGQLRAADRHHPAAVAAGVAPARPRRRRSRGRPRVRRSGPTAAAVGTPPTAGVGMQRQRQIHCGGGLFAQGAADRGAQVPQRGGAAQLRLGCDVEVGCTAAPARRAWCRRRVGARAGSCPRRPARRRWRRRSSRVGRARRGPGERLAGHLVAASGPPAAPGWRPPARCRCTPARPGTGRPGRRWPPGRRRSAGAGSPAGPAARRRPAAAHGPKRPSASGFSGRAAVAAPPAIRARCSSGVGQRLGDPHRRQRAPSARRQGVAERHRYRRPAARPGRGCRTAARRPRCRPMPSRSAAARAGDVVVAGPDARRRQRFRRGRSARTTARVTCRSTGSRWLVRPSAESWRRPYSKPHTATDAGAEPVAGALAQRLLDPAGDHRAGEVAVADEHHVALDSCGPARRPPPGRRAC